MEYVYRHRDWSNLEVLGKNRLPVRPFYCGYEDPETARTGTREQSGNFRLLNGIWKFQYYDSPFLVSPACAEETYDDSAFSAMPVPGHWQLNGFDRPVYNDCTSLFPILDDPAIQPDNPTGVYRHRFAVEKQPDREYLLRFDGVESAYHVFLNGAFLGYSQGSRNTAEFDAADALRDGENLLTVIVYKFCDGSYLENQDMWLFSGIIRDVSLIRRPRIHLADLRIVAGILDADRETGGTLRITADVEGPDVGLTAEAVLYDGEAMLWTGCGGISVGSFVFETELPEAVHWSAEVPKLYRLVLTLKQGEKPVESYGEWVGFREICRKDGLVLVNGKPIKFKGVNRHDWNERTGRCITPEEMWTDLCLMKQHNLNAVRTSHYPPHPDFLDLCDRLGLYVIEEADLECNQMTYTRNMNRLSDDTRWEASYVDRAERMVRRDKNHPCVLLWSLGNESGFGSSMAASGRFVRDYDPTRLIHYEEDRDASIADVYSSMYTRHQALELLGRDTSKPKPHIVCEYAHAMGNGPGGLEEYWEIFNRYPRLQGGFLWEWVDHGIRIDDGNGAFHYAYGGDFGDEPNSGAFCCDGLIQANRRPTPALRQVKKVMEPVRFRDFDPKTGEITVENRYDFRSLDHLVCTFRIHTPQETVRTGEADLSGVGPHREKRMHLPQTAALRELSADQDIWLTLSVAWREAPEWAGEEQEVAFHQELLREAAPKKPAQHPAGSLTVQDRNGILEICGADFTVRFDRIHGYLCGYDWQGRRLIKGGLGLNFWRAPVDNDKNVAQVWEKAMLRTMTNVVDRVVAEFDGPDLVIRVEQTYAPYVLDWKILVRAAYRITPDGTVTLSYHGVPTGVQLPESLPRIGMRFVLDPGCEDAVWYGRGPDETYRDCRMGNAIGLWERSVEEFYFPYVVPQETGNHEDTRWAAFFGPDDCGICVTSAQLFGFSALHYRQEDLTTALHSSELHRTEDIQLCVDYAQHGLGSASWGAECLPGDCLSADPFDFTWKFCGTDHKSLCGRAQRHRSAE